MYFEAVKLLLSRFSDWENCDMYKCQSAEYILELYICIEIRIIPLLIFTEKFSPLLGFEPGRPQYQADMLLIELSWLGSLILS